MKKDIKMFIKSCPSCQVNKSAHKTTKVLMEITTTSQRPFHRVSIDIVRPVEVVLY